MDPSSRRPTAVVVGTGVGGAGSAALLAKAGFEVTVLERNRFTGGRTGTTYRDGFALDMGVHMNASGVNGPCGEINRRIGGNLRWASMDPSFKLVKGNRSHVVGQNMMKLGELYGISRAVGVKTRNIPGTVRALGAVTFARSEADLEPYDEMPLLDYLHRHTDDEDFLRLMEVFCGLAMIVTPAEASAGEFIWCWSRMARTASCSYPKGGFASIPRSYLEVVERLGGSVMTGVDVKRIAVEDGRVTGVETGDRLYPADVVVSNAGIKKTVEMVGAKEFDASYVAKVSSLKESLGGITVKYALDKKIADIPFTLQYDEDADVRRFLRQVDEGRIDTLPFVFIPAPGLLDPGTAPPGKDVMIAGVMVPWGPTTEANARQLLDLCHKKVVDTIPDIERHIVFKEETRASYVATLSGHAGSDVIGLAQSYDQVGRNKPDPVMPVHGLYLVGCDAGGRGIGTEQAADSALKVSDLIIRSHRGEA